MHSTLFRGVVILFSAFLLLLLLIQVFFVLSLGKKGLYSYASLMQESCLRVKWNSYSRVLSSRSRIKCTKSTLCRNAVLCCNEASKENLRHKNTFSIASKLLRVRLSVHVCM